LFAFGQGCAGRFRVFFAFAGLASSRRGLVLVVVVSWSHLFSWSRGLVLVALFVVVSWHRLLSWSRGLVLVVLVVVVSWSRGLVLVVVVSWSRGLVSSRLGRRGLVSSRVVLVSPRLGRPGLVSSRLVVSSWSSWSRGLVVSSRLVVVVLVSSRFVSSPGCPQLVVVVSSRLVPLVSSSWSSWSTVCHGLSQFATDSWFRLGFVSCRPPIGRCRAYGKYRSEGGGWGLRERRRDKHVPKTSQRRDVTRRHKRVT